MLRLREGTGKTSEILRLCEQKICALLKLEKNVFESSEHDMLKKYQRNVVICTTLNCRSEGINVRWHNTPQGILRNEVPSEEFDLFIKPIYDKGILTIRDLKNLNDAGLLQKATFGRNDTVVKEYIMRLLQKYYPRTSRRARHSIPERHPATIESSFVTKQTVKTEIRDHLFPYKNIIHELLQKKYKTSIESSKSHSVLYNYEDNGNETWARMINCFMAKKKAKSSTKWNIDRHSDKLRFFNINKAIKNLPVNAKKAEWYPEEDQNCNHCGQVETISHLFQCIASEEAMRRLKMNLYG
jgi:hypothetical protein